jgi:hypothetical protein
VVRATQKEKLVQPSCQSPLSSPNTQNLRISGKKVLNKPKLEDTPNRLKTKQGKQKAEFKILS